MAIEIGNWVRRTSQKWHFVDSTVSEDVMTRCGRRMMTVKRGKPVEVSTVMPLTRMIDQPQLCKKCDVSVTFGSG